METLGVLALESLVCLQDSHNFPFTFNLLLFLQFLCLDLRLDFSFPPIDTLKSSCNTRTSEVARIPFAFSKTPVQKSRC